MKCVDEYIVGQRPTFDMETRDAGVLTDPAAVTFKFQRPSETETTYVYPTDPELVRDATGKYHVEVTLDEAGYWEWRWETVGLVTAAQGKFRVKAANL